MADPTDRRVEYRDLRCATGYSIDQDQAGAFQVVETAAHGATIETYCTRWLV
jgi:hypothetical protein